MKRQIKRVVILLLIISMALTMLPLDVLASDTDRTTPVSTMQQATQNLFTDVSKSDWFYDAVIYTKQNGIFNGTGTDTFSPNGTMTRAMYVTILGHISGIDTSQYSATAFSDVTAGAWYAPYVEWAAEKGIAAGAGNGKFSPDATITREQMATLTARYFECYTVQYETGERITSQPKDLSAISPWARNAVLKLWQAGLFKGDSNGNFNPRSKVTRAEAAAFGMRTNETLKTWNSNVQQSTAPSAVPNTYTITFDTNGGDTIASRTLRKGTMLSNLPTPYKMNSIFLGWYKDSSLSAPIRDTDTLIRNLTLYAKYSKAAAIEETESVPSVSKLDQAQTFTIKVSDSTGTMTAEQVKAAMTFECLTNPDFAGITVTGSAGHFTVAAQGGMFEAGATCKLTLNGKNLSFTGEDPLTTLYNFTIAKPEIMNLALNDGIIYIPASEVSAMTKNGESVSTLSVPVASVNTGGTDLSTVELSHGTFTYSSTALKVGGNIAIYEGTRPDQRNLETSEANQGAVAYVTITAVDGNTYTYKNSNSQDVLFTPDILPVSDTADTDGDPNNHSITVSMSAMTYTDSNYAQMGLGADTTVDVGDFIAFYSGAFGATAILDSYERITDIRISEGNYVITYTDVTKEQMMAAMDLSRKKNVDGEKILNNTNVDALEKQIEQQAVSSGFVDKSTEYLASLAMETDGFKKLDSKLNLQSYNVKVTKGTQLSSGQVKLMEGKRVQLKNPSIHARLDTNLEHFKGLSGVRCALEVGFDIEIDAGKCNIVIHVSGTFEQEVRLVASATGGAVWKKWWIFPYIADYRLNAMIDAYTYTGIRINASIGTFEKKEEWNWDDKSKVQNIGKQIKELMDKKDQFIGDGINTVAGTLADKYSNMLETNSDWVELFSKDLYSYEKSIDPFNILVFGIKVSFVVTANMNVSIGCDFYYENAKRYIFTIGLFSRTSSSDTVTLVEEKYQFTFYVMGTLGLRAGIKLELSAGLFSLKLDSIGITAEVGAYLRLWGYFYYELTYTASTGKTSKCSGALYLEMGIYLEIKFRAQLFNGTFDYNPTLYENEWPLWSAGSQQNVNDFSYSDADTPEVSMAKAVKTFKLPDSTFSMSYMDMKTGETDQKTYDDSKDFTIQMTNSDFSYNTDTNTITVKPGSKIIDDGQMIVTWKSAPLAFTSNPISRTISLHWENLKDIYTISFNSNGGSAVDTIALPYKKAITIPANPQKTGYLFGGWYRNQDCTQAYKIPAAMPAEDVLLYAKWTPAANTKYTVEHYQQNIVNDLYTLADTDSLTGKTNAAVQPACKTYQGFTAPAVQSLVIADDGSAVLKYYYTRNSYTLKFDANGGTGGSTDQVKYGASISAPVVTKAGDTFASWSTAVASTMPAQNTAYTAQWIVSANTPYKVEHWQQNISSDGYILSEIETLSGRTNTAATAAAKTYTGFTFDGSVPGTVASGNIDHAGTLVLKLYYTRNSYTLMFDATGGIGGSTAQVKYGTPVSAPSVSRSGYVFYGWSPAVASSMPAQSITYTALWTAIPTPPSHTPVPNAQYSVEHWRQNGNSDSYTLLETEHFSGPAGTTATATSKTYTGFSYNGNISGTVASGNIASDGTLALKLYYTRNFTTTAGLDFTTAVADWSTDDGFSSVDWNNGTKMLTLTNAALRTNDTAGSDSFVIHLPTGSTIVLNGANYLISGSTQTATSYGVQCDGDLTIQGGGSLTSIAGSANINSNNNCIGIYADGNIIVSADVIATGSRADGISCGAVGGSLSITGGTVTLTSGSADTNSFGIYTTVGDVNVSGGTFTVQSGNGLLASFGIYSANTINISGGITTAIGNSSAMNTAPALTGTTVSAASGNTDGSSSTTYNSANIADYKYLNIQP